MADQIGESVYVVRGESRPVESMLDKVEQRAQKTTRSLTMMERGSSFAFGAMGKSAMAAGLAVQTGLAYATLGISALIAGMVALSGASIGMAGDAAEVGSKFDVVFGDNAESARASLDEFAASARRSKAELYEMASSIQDTFVPLGFSRDKAAQLSDAVTKLAVDVASFNNMSDVEALEAMKSALIGNHETVRRFGVIITETTLNAKLLEMGIAGGTEAATEQQKAVARLKMIMEGTSDAHGDAIRTGDSFSNSMKGLWGIIKDLGVEFGSALLPAAGELIAFFRDGLQWVQDNTSSLQEWGQTLGTWVKFGLDQFRAFIAVVMNLDLVYEMAGIAIAEFFTGVYDRGKWAFDNAWIAAKWFFDNFAQIAEVTGHNFIQLWLNVSKNMTNIFRTIWNNIRTGGRAGMAQLVEELQKGFKHIETQPEFKEFKSSGNFEEQWRSNEKEWERRMKSMADSANKTGEMVKKELDFDALMKEGGGKSADNKIKVEISSAEEIFRKGLLARFDPGEGKKQTELQARIAAATEAGVKVAEKTNEKLDEIKPLTVTE